jgi:hypothetical protein
MREAEGRENDDRKEYITERWQEWKGWEVGGN